MSLMQLRVVALALSVSGVAAPTLAVALEGVETPLADLAQGALPPAPGKVQLQTKSFGSITLDHPAHLARKIACKQCHGSGPVRKPVFTPKIAHETCVTCHREGQRGPTKCRDCHVVPQAQASALVPAAPATQGATKELAAAGAAGAAPVQGRALGSPTAASGATAAPPGAAAVPGTPERAPQGFVRTIGLGYTGFRSTNDKIATALSFLLTAREESFLLLQSVDRTVGGLPGAGGRTMALVGAGVRVPVSGRYSAIATGVGGIDAPEKPSAAMLPAAGVRAGMEWLGRQYCATLSVTGLTDLARGVDPVTHATIGGTTLSVTLTAGFVLDRQ